MTCSRTLGGTRKQWLKDIKQIADDKAKTINVDIYVDEVILADVIDKWCEEAKKVEVVLGDNSYVSAFRVGGFLTFWIRKLKPFSVTKYKSTHIKKQLYINEILAVVIGISLVYGALKSKKAITDGVFERFLTSLRYSSMSPFSVALIYEYLYE